MSSENSRRDEIVNKYSKLFGKKLEAKGQRRWPIFYGFEHDDGWLDIIEDLCSSIQWYVDNKQARNPEYLQPEVLQVKEKFGTLRFYVSNTDDYVNGLIAFAEKLSARTCEKCGGAGKFQRGGWIKVMCDPCYALRNEQLLQRAHQHISDTTQQLQELQKNEQE